MAKRSNSDGQALANGLVCGLAIAVAAMVLHVSTDFVGAWNAGNGDFASTSTSKQPSDRIAIIAIDDQSIANLGAGRGSGISMPS